MLLEKLESLRFRFEEVNILLGDPKVLADQKRFMQLNREYKELEKLTQVYKTFKNVLDNIETNKQIINTEKDEEFRELAKVDLQQLEAERSRLEEEIKVLLVPKDPEDDKDCILEIRAGTGGDEASIFAGDLFRMYTRYIEEKGWKMEVININEGTAGGYKEISAEVIGENVYGVLKFESGVHRVQRVPATESQGRIHTSAATVAVLPEVDDVSIDVRMEDIKVDTFRSSGAGGQHINKTESAVRFTHLPTGVIVECQEGRSQLKNRETAMKMLRAKLYEMKMQEQQSAIASQRKELVSTGDRSAKIRTYNFPQGRVTDHRIGLTLYNLPEVMNGGLDELITSLRVAENTERLKAGGLA